MRIIVVGANHGLVMAKRLNSIAGVEVVGIVGRRLIAGTGFDSFVTLSDAFAKGVADAAVVACPTSEVAGYARTCLQHGLHVLAEKPMCLHEQTGTALLQLARSRGLCLNVGYQRPYSESFSMLKGLLDSGRIGKVLGVNMIWAACKPPRYFDVSWKRKRDRGGGILYINLVHELSLLTELFEGEIQVLDAQSKPGPDDRDDSLMAITLQVGGNVLVTILGCDSAPSPFSYEACSGENSAIARVPGFSSYVFLGSGGTLTYPNINECLPVDGNGWHSGVRVHSYPQAQTPSCPWLRELAGFVDGIRCSTWDYRSIENALKVSRVCEQIVTTICKSKPPMVRSLAP